MAERKEILRDKKIRFDYRSAIPSLTLIVALLTEILIPNHMDAKYRTLTNFKSVLITFTVVSLLLLLISIFHEKTRNRYVRKGWFLGGTVVFITMLNLVTVKLLLLPQIYFPSINRILNVYIEDKTCCLSALSVLLLC